MNTVQSITPTPFPLPKAQPVMVSGGTWNAVTAIAGVVLKELYRRKDFYVLFILTSLLTVSLGSVNIFGEAKLARYLKEICLLFIWISGLIIAVTTTARQIPAERENRTLFPLLAKPVTRNQLLLGKFLGCWAATGLALLTFYVFFSALSWSREHEWHLASYVQGLVLHWMMLGIVVAMTLLGSIVFAAPSSNSTIIFVVSVGILLMGRHLNKVALQCGEPLQTIISSVYYLLPHLELFDVRDLLIHNWAPIPWLVWLGAIAYATVYIALFLFAGTRAFKRKAVN